MTRYETSKIFKIALSCLFFIVFVTYIFFNSRVFIAGPQININYPANGDNLKEEQLIKIKGSAQNISYLRLNNRQISVDENGNFNESFLLSNGYNIILVTAKDRFGREETEKIQVIYSGEMVKQKELYEAPASSTPEQIEEEENESSEIL